MLVENLLLLVDAVGLPTLLLTVLVGLVILWYFLQNRNLPPGPIGLPYLGYLPYLGPTPHLKLAELAKKYGDVMSFTVTGRTHIHLNGLDVIKEALVTKGDEFNGRPQEFSMINWFDDGMGITQTEGQVWREQRRFFLQRAKDFGYGKISLEGHIQEIIQMFLSYVERSKGKPYDIHIPLSNSTSNVICQILFNKQFDFGDQDFKLIANNLRTMVEYFLGSRVFIIGPLAKLIFKYLPGGAELERGKKNLHSTVRKFILQHQENFDKENLKDFTDVYLDEINKLEAKGTLQETSFSMSRLHCNDVNLLLEGTESVSATIYLMIKELAKHEEIQRKIQKEMDDVIGSERMPSWADRTSLPYTEAAIYELERIVITFPLAATHSNPRKTTLRGYTIPERSVIVPSLYSIHRDPDLWPDPERFDPTRFLNPDGKCEKREGLYLFSLGKRACPGESLAVMEIFLFITSLLQRFNIGEPGPGINDPEKINYQLIATPRFKS